MLEIKFKKGEILLSIVLRLSAIAFIIYFMYNEGYILMRFLGIPFLLGIIWVLRLRINQVLKNYNSNNYSALKIDEKGIFNNTLINNFFIEWKEIAEFKTGYFSHRQIFIEPKNPTKYPIKKYFGIAFSSKADMLWIDSDVIDMNRQELLQILNNKLYIHKLKL